MHTGLNIRQFSPGPPLPTPQAHQQCYPFVFSRLLLPIDIKREVFERPSLMLHYRPLAEMFQKLYPQGSLKTPRLTIVNTDPSLVRYK